MVLSDCGVLWEEQIIGRKLDTPGQVGRVNLIQLQTLTTLEVLIWSGWKSIFPEYLMEVLQN